MTNVSPSGARILACRVDEGCRMIQCEVCLTEIPISVAQRFEGADYVHHFCGLECFGVWRAKEDHLLPEY